MILNYKYACERVWIGLVSTGKVTLLYNDMSKWLLTFHLTENPHRPVHRALPTLHHDVHALEGVPALGAGRSVATAGPGVRVAAVP